MSINVKRNWHNQRFKESISIFQKDPKRVRSSRMKIEQRAYNFFFIKIANVTKLGESQSPHRTASFQEAKARLR